MVKAKQVVKIASIFIGVLFFIYLGSVLPRMQTGLFASPDETAVSIFSQAWSMDQGFRIPVKLQDSIKDVVQLHPRSMIRQGDWLVPVGFLGMPFFVALMNGVSSSAGQYLVLILVLSSAIPFYFLLKKELGTFTAWSAVLIYLSFPTVLLYVNRGFFPNLPVVALAMWGIWISRLAITCAEGKKNHEWIICSSMSGLCFGLALFIRPIEAIWMIPWMIWSVWPLVKKNIQWVVRLRVMIPLVLCMVLVGLLGIWLSMKTYPFHQTIFKQPISGYQLKDFVASSNQGVAPVVATRSLQSLIPISIHPRVLWQNIRIFLFNHQGIWVGPALLGALLAWLHWKRKSIPLLLLSGWVAIVLFLMYGQVIYADNITGSATLGNSFLRYLLPLVPLIALGCAVALNALRLVSKRGRFLAICSVIFLVGYGTAYALSGDNESILATRRELVRYLQIREMAEAYSMHGSVILSERSDKIFASGQWTVVSPIPDQQALITLRDSNVPMYLFHRKMYTETDVPESISNVFYFVGDPVLELDNEALYPILGSLE